VADNTNEQQLNDLLKARIALYTELNKKADEFAEEVEEIVDAEGRSLDQIKLHQEALEQQLQLLRNSKQEQEESLRLEVNRLAQMRTRRGIAQEELEAQQNKVKLMWSLASLGDDELAKQKEILENLKKQNIESAKAIKALQKLRDHSAEIAKNIGGMLGVTEQWKGTLIGAFIDGGKHGHSLSTRFKELGAAMKTQFSSANLLGSAMMKVQESTLKVAAAVSESRAEVNKITLAGGGYNEMMEAARQSNLHVGATAASTGQALLGLNAGFRGFGALAKNTQRQMLDLAVTMEALGIAAGDMAEMYQIGLKVLGQTPGEVGNTVKSLAQLSVDIGVPAQTLVKEYAAASTQLAKYGQDMNRVFEKLAASSAALGSSMSSLMQYTSQYDTFEGAAHASARLNALLGGQMLNTMDMMHASEEERVRLTLQAVEASGQRLDAENKFAVLAFKSAAGLQSEAEAYKFLTMGATGYEKVLQQKQREAMANKEIEKRAQAAMSVQKKFMQVVESFAIAVGPLVDGVNKLAKGFLWLQTNIPYGLVNWLIGLGMAYKLVQKFMVKGPAKLAEAIARGKNAAVARAEAKALQQVAAAGSASIPYMLAFAATTLSIGAAISAVILSFGYMITMIADVTPELNKAGKGFLYMGAGVGVLAAGVAVLAVTGKLAFVGLAALSLGLLAVAGALAMIKTDDLQSLGNMFGGLGKIAEYGGVNVANVARSIKEIASVASEMEGANINTFVKVSHAVERIGVAEAAVAQATRPAIREVAGLGSKPPGQAHPSVASPGIAAAHAAAPAAATPRQEKPIEWNIVLKIAEHDIKPVIESIQNNASPTGNRINHQT
tara:strand:+ start:3417 stop:5927 length:2511 start_codon:yes stop_codon:yes gene_type:complete